MQKMVYKLKEEHVKGGSGQKRKREKQRLRVENKRETEELYQLQKQQRSPRPLKAFYIREGEPHHSKKVNLVLNTHALQIILFGPIYVRAQHRVRSFQIVSLH